MKLQELGISSRFSRISQAKEIGQPGWSNYLQPIDEHMPQHNFECQCLMCNELGNKKFKQALKLQTTTIEQKIYRRIATSNSARNQKAEQNMRWILMHLMLPQHKIAICGLPIYVTQTLFFKDGQAYEFFMCKQLGDSTLKRVPKQKLTNTYIQKVISERRRKYKEQIRQQTGRKKVEPKTKLLYGQKQVRKEIKDAVLVRYVDGYEQLLTQNQFLSMFLRRKQDPLWRSITSIRNFVDIANPEEKDSCYLVKKYKKGNLQYLNLFKRAQTITKIYGKYISAEQTEYISPKQQQEFCRQLRGENINIFSQYLTYLIVNYIEYFYDQQIMDLVIGLYFDPIGKTFINQVHKLETKSATKFDWTNEIYRRKMNEEQIKILAKTAQIKQVEESQTTKNIGAVMFQAYECMRDRHGLNPEQQDNKQEAANNKFFKILHPNLKSDISEILKDSTLTISEFKRKYLGYKEKKKPIIKEFTSTMITTLHELSPRLKKSVPHDYIKPPNKSGFSIVNNKRRTSSVWLTPLKNGNSGMYKTLELHSVQL